MLISVQLGSDLRVLDHAAMSKLRRELELLLWWWNGSCCCGGRDMGSKKLDDRGSNMAEESGGGGGWLEMGPICVGAPRWLFLIAAAEIASARESNSSSPLDDCRLPLFPESISTLFFFL